MDIKRGEEKRLPILTVRYKWISDLIHCHEQLKHNTKYAMKVFSRIWQQICRVWFLRESKPQNQLCPWGYFPNCDWYKWLPTESSGLARLMKALKAGAGICGQVQKIVVLFLSLGMSWRGWGGQAGEGERGKAGKACTWADNIFLPIHMPPVMLRVRAGQKPSVYILTPTGKFQQLPRATP